MSDDQQAVSVTCIEAFAVNTQLILLNMLDCPSERGATIWKEHVQPSYDVVVMIHLSGTESGYFFISMGKEIAFQVAETMLEEALDPNDHKTMASALTEFCNLVAGHALMYLEYNDKPGMAISTPIIFYQNEHPVQLSVEAENGVIEFQTHYGVLEICVSTTCL